MKKEIKLDSNGKRKFGMLDKVAYAAGDLGCNMSFGLKNTVQIFWLAFMMLETGLLSALLLVVQIWDAVNDPMIGALIDADRRKYRMGKFKTYIFIGACALVLGGAAVFLPFPNAPVFVKAVLFILGYVIWDAAYTIANVPYGSMLSLVTEDSGERAQLSTWRSIGSMVGNILPSVILPFIIWHKVVDENGEPVINPETGVQEQILLGDRVFLFVRKTARNGQKQAHVLCIGIRLRARTRHKVAGERNVSVTKHPIVMEGVTQAKGAWVGLYL